MSPFLWVWKCLLSVAGSSNSNFCTSYTSISLSNFMHWFSPMEDEGSLLFLCCPGWWYLYCLIWCSLPNSFVQQLSYCIFLTLILKYSWYINNYTHLICTIWWVWTIFIFLFWLLYCWVQFSSVAQSCPTLCDPVNRNTPGLPVHHQLPEFTQT